MKKNKAPKPRIPIATAVSPELYDRIAVLRSKKWKITELLKLGIETAEKLEKKS